MPASINGFGTAFYGSSAKREDCSFVTTECMIALYIPLVPIRSFRVIRAPHRDVNVIIARSVAYRCIERVPIAWAQILGVYAFMALSAGWFCLSLPLPNSKFKHAMDISDTAASLIWLASLFTCILLPFAIAWMLVRISDSKSLNKN